MFDLLDENPLLSAKMMCTLLGIEYKKRRKLIWKYKCQWKRKTSLNFQTGSKCLKPQFHKPSAWVYVDRLKLDFEKSLYVGWIQTKSKNHYLLFKSPGYGHMKWFPGTGRVNIHTTKPHTKGRLFQLFCNGFSMNGLIDSVQILDSVLKSIRLKGAHAIFPSRERLPYMEIKMFQLSNGVVVKMGDKSHPNAIEIQYTYPDFAEKNERLLREIYQFFRGSPETPKRKVSKNNPYVS